MEKEKSQSHISLTRKIVQTSLFIGLAIAVRSLSTMVYFLGAPGMRINFSGIFAKLPALLFGPLYGGIATGIVDVIGYLLKPEGPFIPFLTLTAILGGVITGYLWRVFKNSDTGKLQKGMWTIFILLGIIGLFNFTNVQFFPSSSIALLIKETGKYEGFFTLGLVSVSVVGSILLILDYAVRKKFPEAALNKYYIKILLPYGISGLIVTILNTWILILYFPALAKIGFVIYLIPRLVEEIFMMVVQSYIAAFLLTVYDRVIKRG
ncbi:MAG: ECF transporter S component [Clostridiaceae bacterium]|nr:ECF transporter S component [Clostridiaceae bacterium]